MDTQKLADLLFPNINKSIEYYLSKYPARDLAESAEVTRFAPSPTGYMHIGGVYQALLNGQVAHSTGGVFYLRNEDTDSKREKEGAANIIYPALEGFGVAPDEGFVSESKEIGNYGPYTQSKRKEIYQAFVKELVAKGFAYPCFCTNENESAKSEQMRLGLPTGYYGRWATCRDLSLVQIENNLKNNMPYTIRIKANGDGNKKIKFHDERLGDMLFPVNSNDYVILKSDGQALYHLAHLVDDSLMRTTIVIRDESWLPSVPLHLQLFEFAGLTAPKYLHTPTINTIDAVSGNARKVSKRHDDWADSRWFHSNGFPKEAIQEYLLNILNSTFEPWREENPTLPISDFKFSIDKMSKSGALFDIAKLRNISREVISRMSAEEVYERMLVWTQLYDAEYHEILKKNKELSIEIYNMDRKIARPRKDIVIWSEVKETYSYMYNDNFEINFGNSEKITNSTIKMAIEKYISEYSEVDTQEEWFARMKKVAGDCGFATEMKEYKKNPDMFVGSVADFSSIIRVAISGRTQTPDLYMILQVLGRDKVTKRLQKALNTL